MFRGLGVIEGSPPQLQASPTQQELHGLDTQELHGYQKFITGSL